MRKKITYTDIQMTAIRRLTYEYGYHSITDTIADLFNSGWTLSDLTEFGHTLIERKQQRCFKDGLPTKYKGAKTSTFYYDQLLDDNGDVISSECVSLLKHKRGKINFTPTEQFENKSRSLNNRDYNTSRSVQKGYNGKMFITDEQRVANNKLTGKSIEHGLRSRSSVAYMLERERLNEKMRKDGLLEEKLRRILDDYDID